MSELTGPLGKALLPFRRRVLVLRITKGLAILVTSAIALVGGALLLDRWVLLAPAARVGVTGVAVAAVLGVFLWRVLRVLRPLRTLDVVRAIEAERAEFDEGLSTAVELRQAASVPEEFSTELQEAVELRAIEQLGNVPVGQVPKQTGTRRVVVVSLLAVAVCACVVALRPDDTALLWRRFLAPTRELPRPSSVVVSVRPGDTVLRRGAGCDVEAVLERGRPTRAELWVREDGSGWRLARQLDGELAEGESAYHFSLEELERSFRYRVVAGDYQSPEYIATVRDPARVLSYKATYREPSYTGRGPRTETPVSRQLVSLRGSVVQLELRASESLGAVASRRGNADPVAWSVAADKARSPPVELEESGILRVLLESLDGVTNDWAEEIVVLVRPDRTPRVELVTPRSPTVRVDSDDALALHYRAEDDIEVTQLRLIVEGGLRQEIPLSLDDGSAHTNVDGSQRHEVTGFVSLPVAALGLAAGDTATFYLEVADALEQTATSARRLLAQRHAPAPPEGRTWLQTLRTLAAGGVRLATLWGQLGERLRETGGDLAAPLVASARGSLYEFGVRLGEAGEAVPIPSRARRELLLQGRRLRRVAVTTALEAERQLEGAAELRTDDFTSARDACSRVHAMVDSTAVALLLRLEQEELEEAHERVLALAAGCRRLVRHMAGTSPSSMAAGWRRLSGVLRREAVATGAFLQARLGTRSTGARDADAEAREARVVHALLEQIVPELDTVARGGEQSVLRRHALRARTLLDAQEDTLGRLYRSPRLAASPQRESVDQFLVDLGRLRARITSVSTTREESSESADGLRAFIEWPLLELTEDIGAAEKQFRPYMDGVFDLVALREVYVQRARTLLADRTSSELASWPEFLTRLGDAYTALRAEQTRAALGSRAAHVAALEVELVHSLPREHGFRDLRRAVRLGREMTQVVDGVVEGLESLAAPELTAARTAAGTTALFVGALDDAATRSAREGDGVVEVKSLVTQGRAASEELMALVARLDRLRDREGLELTRAWLQGQLEDVIDAVQTQEGTAEAGEGAAPLDDLIARQARADQLFEQLLGAEPGSAEAESQRAELQKEVEEIAAEAASRLVTLKELMDLVAQLLVLEKDARDFESSVSSLADAARVLRESRDAFARRGVAVLGGAAELAERSYGARKPLAAAFPALGREDAELRTAEHALGSGAQSAAHELLAWKELDSEESSFQAEEDEGPLERVTAAADTFVAAVRLLRVAALAAVAEVERAGAGGDSSLAVSSRAEQAAREAAEELRSGSAESAQRAHRAASRALSLAASRLSAEQRGNSGPPGAGARTESLTMAGGMEVSSDHVWRVLPRGAEPSGDSALERDGAVAGLVYPPGYRTLVRLYLEALAAGDSRGEVEFPEAGR